MSHSQKALHRHVDAPPPTREQAPVISTIRKKNTIGDVPTGDASERKSPNYADVGNETMTPDLIMQYRARIASGVYDAPATIKALAEALLASNDL